MKRILGIGNALVDILTLIDDDSILEKFDLPKGSMQLVDLEKSEKIKAATRQYPQTRSSGGSAANTIHGLAMLGIDTGFIGSIGRDETGDFFEKDMKSAGINTLLIRRNVVSGTAIALISQDSERTFATHLGAAVELNADDLSPILFQGYDILYIEGYLIPNLPLVEKACKLARINNMKVALDLASYNVVQAHHDSFVRIITEYTDILFANEMEADAFTKAPADQMLSFLSGFGEIVIYKIGAKGSWIIKGNETIKIDAYPVQCNDTTGAGDLYAAGFLYGQALGLNLEKCGLIGSLMAGKVIEILGARMNKQNFEEIKRNIEAIIQTQ